MTFEEYWQQNYASKGYQYGEEALSLVKMGWEMHNKFVNSSLNLSSEDTALLSQMIGSENEFPEVTLQIGHVKNEDDTVEFGLLIHYTEYPEDGALLIKNLD